MLPIAACLLAALPGLTDCNNNGIDDAIEIAKGLAADCQGNGYIDDCERGGITPRGYWRLEEPGGTTIADSGPLGLDGSTSDTNPTAAIGPVLIPATGAENLLGRTIAGSGSILVPDPAGDLSFGDSDFTIEAWVRIDQRSDTSGPNQRQTIVQKKAIAAGGATTDYLFLAQAGDASENATQNYGKNADFTGRELAIIFGTGSSTWMATSSFEIRDGNWHHVSVSLNAVQNKVRFTLDDGAQTINFDEQGHTTNNGPLLIGAHTNASGNFNQFLRGAIDEVRIVEGVLPLELLLDDHRGGDCNGNGIPDGCDIADGAAIDCDGNGQPDSCQLVDNDCDGNGVPDQCDPDCNGNGIADACDIALAVSDDCQPDGIPDECQTAGNTRLQFDLYGWGYIAVRTDVPYMVWLQRFNANANDTVVDAIEVDFGIIPVGTPLTACIWSDPNGDGEPADAQLIWSIEGSTGDNEGLITIDVPEIAVGDRNATFFIGFSMEVNAASDSEDFPAALDIFGDPEPGRSWLIGSIDPIDLNDLRTYSEEYGLVENRYMRGNWVIRAITMDPAIDCNDNGVPDDCDVAEGTSPDVDGDGRPDECGDCNGNGILDGFEIAAGDLGDCDGDAIPDICQTTSNDCDGDGVPDACQIAAGGDCNGNGILDTCDIATIYEYDDDGNGIPDSCEDCNGNGQLDYADIAFGISEDCDFDEIPDECQFGEPTPTRTYGYDDGEPESYLNLIGGTDFAWMVRHFVEPGGEWIGAVDVTWGYSWSGQDAKVAVWRDPNGDGNPDDAELLTEVFTETTDVFTSNKVRVPIPPTYVGEAGTSFFVGAWYRSPYGGSPIMIDDAAPGVPNEWNWVVYDIGVSVDLANLNQHYFLHWPYHNFFVDGIAHDGTSFPADCNGNGTIDICDILDGESLDDNGNGIPDECESACPADLDANGVVNGADMGLFFVQWGACTGDCSADFNGDGQVNGVDLGSFLKAWGACEG